MSFASSPPALAFCGTPEAPFLLWEQSSRVDKVTVTLPWWPEEDVSPHGLEGTGVTVAEGELLAAEDDAG